MGGVFSSKRRRSSPSQPADGMPPSGFQDKQVFKIISMKDRNVIEVASTPTGESIPVVVKRASNAQSQKFKAILIRPGEFRLYSLAGAGPPGSWDYQPGQPFLIHGSWQDGPYQIFNAEEVHPNSNICIIKSADGTCLTNSGAGNQISLAKENRKDPKQHWKLELTY